MGIDAGRRAAGLEAPCGPGWPGDAVAALGADEADALAQVEVALAA